MKYRKPRVADNPIQVQPEKKEHPRLRKMIAWMVCVFLLLIIGVMVFASIFPTNNLLKVPGNVVAGTVAPIQNIFSSITNTVVGYFRTLKLRSNLEFEYNRVVSELEQARYQAMRVEELERDLAVYKDIADEMSFNEAMNPIACRVIGRGESNNYFSVFTINKGSNDGIENFMAVTTSEALVGYTYDVKANSASVRSIIDSEAKVPGLIQLSRDQGIVSGALGEDGTPTCRMLYQEGTLPRPGDMVVTSGVGSVTLDLAFPRGIPIGTVRESTRGMDSNKQYIVIEPIVDFQHIENVIVLRYKPDAIAVEDRGNASASSSSFVPLDSPRPLPSLIMGDTVITFGTPTPSPDPNATPSPTPSPTPTPRPIITVPPSNDSIEYQVPNSGTSETQTPQQATNPPTPSPTPTFSLDNLTVEGD